MQKALGVAAVAAASRGDMNTPRVCCMLLALLLSGVSSLPAFAAGAGEVTHLSGTLSVQRPDGTILVLAQKSEVLPADFLTTQKDSYAQINFSDGSSVTMRPNTQMKIDAYSFVKERPEADNAFFRLIKGGLRTVTGLVGKRGNQDAYRIGTSTATIGIRGSGGETRVSEAVDHYTFLGTYEMCNQAGCQLIEQGFSARADNEKDPIRVSKGHFDPKLPTPPTDLKLQMRGSCGK